MRRAVALRLNALDASFYQTQARSFSDTRQAPWPGWARCLEVATGVVAGVRMSQAQAPGGRVPGVPRASDAVRVLDVACGNLRFARFLADAWPEVPVIYEGVDSCPELAAGGRLPVGWQVTLQERDVVTDLANGAHEGRGTLGERGVYDLVACFGFMHHVPGAGARERLVRELVSLTRPGGVCCVSLWRFLDDDRLARKAERDTVKGLASLGLREGDLDSGDCLLGWQDRPDVWRYCHGFDDAEVTALAGAAGDKASLAARFRSDGRSGRLNEYLVLRRR